VNQHAAARRAARWSFTVALLLLPLLLQAFGHHWVRIADTCLLYLMLALGMNIVVGNAGLLDLGYVAFYAIGAYMMALLTSPHLSDNFAWIAAMFPAGLHTPWWITIPLAALLAAGFGILLGAPTLKLRGDYLAIVTLGFGEIVRLLIINLGRPVNITNGAKGLGPIDSIGLFGPRPGQAVVGRRPRARIGHAVLLPVPGAGDAYRDHLPPLAGFADGQGLDGDPRRRGGRPGHGHRQPAT